MFASVVHEIDITIHIFNYSAYANTWQVFEKNEKRMILYEEGSDRRLAEIHVEELHRQILWGYWIKKKTGGIIKKNMGVVN